MGENFVLKVLICMEFFVSEVMLVFEMGSYGIVFRFGGFYGSI